MKVTDGMKLISKGWIQKPKELRVRFQQLADRLLETRYSPPLDEKGMDSDVTVWRYAWKLYMATKTDDTGIGPEELVNLTVVDETDTPITYYVTGRTEVMNPKQPTFLSGSE